MASAKRPLVRSGVFATPAELATIAANIVDLRTLRNADGRGPGSFVKYVSDIQQFAADHGLPTKNGFWTVHSRTAEFLCLDPVDDNDPTEKAKADEIRQRAANTVQTARAAAKARG